MEEKFLKSISEAIETIRYTSIEKGEIIFRGQVNWEWKHFPSLFRKHPNDAQIIERALLETLLKGVRGPFLDSFDPIEHFMNLQHFGIPTRLLDWTSDLLVALFFACYDENGEYNHKDGSICILYRADHATLKLNSKENEIFKNPISKDNLEFFKNRLATNDIYIIEPIIKNPKMRIQDGCFVFFSFLPIHPSSKEFVSLEQYHKERNKRIREQNSDNNTSNPPYWRAYIKVDKDYKKAILTELDRTCGISKESLFVEIDHIRNTTSFYESLYEIAIKKAEWAKQQRKK